MSAVPPLSRTGVHAPVQFLWNRTFVGSSSPTAMLASEPLPRR